MGARNDITAVVGLVSALWAGDATRVANVVSRGDTYRRGSQDEHPAHRLRLVLWTVGRPPCDPTADGLVLREAGSGE